MYQINTKNESSLRSPLLKKELLFYSTEVLKSENAPSLEISILFIDKNEMQTLNRTYRHKNYPTNVLSFPCDPSFNTYLTMPYLGDIAVCLEIVREESAIEMKTFRDHLIHITIHGILHLLGYDHIDESEAIIMQSKEIYLLKQWNISNPYERDSNDDH
jgi:probable rRNA maturation factor